MAENGEDKLIAVARHIAKTLGRTETMADDILQIFSTFDGRFSREKMSEKSDDDRSFSGLERTVRDLDQRMARWGIGSDFSADPPIWSDSSEAAMFLDAVDELVATIQEWEPLAGDKTVAGVLDRADNILQQAMFKLEEEFRFLIERNSEAVDPCWLFEEPSSSNDGHSDTSKMFDSDEEEVGSNAVSASPLRVSLSTLLRSPPFIFQSRVACKVGATAPAAFSGTVSTDSHQKVEVSAMEPGGSCSDSKMKKEPLKLKLEELNWDHSFVRELPGDPRTDALPREVLHACYTKVSPSAEVESPELVVWSESVAELLDLDPSEFGRPDFPLLFSGASPLVGGLQYAQCYGGHQFGMWAGQLGDGRAITLGEILNSRGQRWELQLKGAGKTPYSRFADGLAVLRSSIREFLCSEAMHSLGIPTTRALCLVTTGKDVTRDMFYDGNPKEEPGAIVCRVAQSFLRFGSFQLHAKREKEDLEIVRVLADYAIRHHFPHLENMSKSESLSFMVEGQESPSGVDLTSNKYAAWVVEVAERTAFLIASWQGVGFTHGVLNTDNMSVLGLTIDYGPFGFLDAFDPSYTPNTTDLPGRRYCFANQPDIGLWNIAQFTATLSAAQLISTEEANYAMERYGTKFMDEYQSIMTRKLGLQKYNKQLISKLLNNMAVDKVDYTIFFRSLSNIKSDPSVSEDKLLVPLKAVLLDISKERKAAWISWMQTYMEELASNDILDEQRKAAMDAVNPKFILRNYLCQSAIDAAEQGDYGEVRRLLKVMERPYDEQEGMEKYARLPPAWAYRPGVCMLSCSS